MERRERKKRSISVEYYLALLQYASCVMKSKKVAGTHSHTA